MRSLLRFNRDGREKVWVRKEAARTVVPKKKDARGGHRDTPVRSKEVESTVEVMKTGENNNEGDRKL
jgi:hypothetical protein